MSAEPVCHLFALWRRERDLAQFDGAEPTDLMGSAARLSGPPSAGGARKRWSAWWKDDWLAR
jgi:hypothetical protein